MTFAAAPVLVEEAVATAATELTAEQIAAQVAQQAAEQAAAEAARQAAEQAAAQAAEQAAAQAAEQAAQQTAQQVVQQAPPSGIETLAKEVKAGLDVSQLSNVQPEGIQQIVNAANYPVPPTTPVTPPIPSVPNVVPPGAEYIPPSNFGPPAAPPAAPTAAPPIQPQPPVEPSNLRFTDAMQGPGTNSPPFGPTQSAMNVPPGVDRFPTQAATEALPNGGMQMRDAPTPYEWTPQTTAANAGAATQPSGIESLFNQGLDYAKKNPLSMAMGANALVNYLNKPKPYEKPKYKSTFNASAYRGYEPPTPDYYRPKYAHGGLADLGGYSDGGRMLKGPGDGMSDDIPATIANKQPARLANEEFVIPADVVSHLGNGSSEAGAKQLYKMMDRVRQARTGNKKQGKQINPEKYLA
jgi:hypothetical protein